MANYTTTANVVLSVNGKQAQRMLSQLEKDAKRLEKQIATAAKAGDKATMKKLQRELKSTQRMMEQLKGSSASVDDTLRRLDKATPKELNKALKLLQQQLNGIQRGTPAWDAHVAKIKAVKAELQKVNATLATQKSLWDRMNTWLNNAQTSLMGIAAALAGLVMAGRKAVNAFAEMEEELANTKKYTGLSDEMVRQLNEAFKKMDTRTPREKLNELAQEAGRLGKNTLESVQGYVEAADIINVALVDLGAGATQTIAKLINIFGVEQMLGTKDAMLAVGSTVNVLSQNCTASKPYLVEFAQRMAGIGSQAGLTIPQILAFGAVLDANGQKVEMSATAIQKAIMNLANKNHEFAAVVGLDAEQLNATLKRSAKDGLIMFLEALKRIGDSAGFENATMSLAPALSDMGLDAARVSQVLSTLAKHLDEVKWQMGEADKAFTAASSATHEYEIFNNTAQAAIDKARKRVGELAIELGEKLYPIMKHIYTSSGIFLRVLNTLVDFFIKYRREIVAGVAAIAAYNAVMAVYRYHTVMATRATTLFHGVMRLVRQILPAVRLLFTPLVNAIQYFTNGLEVNYAMQERWRKSMAAMKFSNWAGLILALGAAIYAVASRFKTAAEEAEKARKEQEEYRKSLTDLDEKSSEYCHAEIARLEALYKEATDEAKSTDERRKAAEKLQALYPDYFKNLSTEQIMVGQAKTAYDQLRDSIIEVARARAAADKIVENEKQLLTLEQQAPGLKQKRDRDKATHNAAVAEWENARQMESYQSYTNSTDAAAGQAVNVAPYARRVASTGETYNASEAAYQENLRKQRQLNQSNEFLRKKYNVSAEALQTPGNPDVNLPGNTPITSVGGGAGAGAAEDKFAKEKEWREQAEASARISYATGETNYLEYTQEMDRIAVEFCEKQLLHTNLTETERLKITAEWREAQLKQQQHLDEQTIEQENSRHNTELAGLKQFYIDGSISKETYDLKMEEAEIEHQRKLIALTKEGSRERLQAEQQLQSLLIAQVQRKQQEREKLEAKYAAIKKDYFGDNPQEAQAKYDADLALLDVVYQRELAAAGDNAAEKLRIDEAYEQAKLALKKKYGLLAEEDTRNAMEKGIADSVEWLNGDGGKALTGTLDTLVSGMSAIFSQLSTMMQAELEIQTASINKRYDAEISRAEGNTYKVKKLEKDKEKELAKAKKEANRKMFAMQVIQAVAQTATNALNAYGSAAAVPVVGYILAPIAAAMAVAAGVIQIAAIKKQQQASEAQGYAEGGFTPSGGKDEVAGVVHKGEWVASQRLVNNPRTRPLLEALDYAQRNNTIGSITSADVSRTITAPAVLAAQPQAPTVVNNTTYNSNSESTDRITSVLDRLDSRLNEPFVTVNTVTGDHGIQQAQDEYDRLMKNKSPKSKK
jgi:TP901 family phage tail tape measure protein